MALIVNKSHLPGDITNRQKAVLFITCHQQGRMPLWLLQSCRKCLDRQRNGRPAWLDVPGKSGQLRRPESLQFLEYA